jgi:predicted ATPase
MTKIVSNAYSELVQAGQILHDDYQQKALGELDNTYTSLHLSPLRRLLSPRPKGLYIVGDVGRGKTFLMDLFFKLVKTPKKRQHYHLFIQELYQLIHQENWVSTLSTFYKNANVLCLDEFQLTDIGDSMLLYRFFKGYFDHGGTLITTANLEPKDFPLNQERSLHHLLMLIADHCTVVPISSNTDYRSESNIIIPIEESSENQKVLTLSFNDLFFDPVGTKYYTQILKPNTNMVITNGFSLNDENLGAVVRFIQFIDLAYESAITLKFSPTVSLDQIYVGKKYLDPFKRTASRLKKILVS